jgi:hypothetical protein
MTHETARIFWTIFDGLGVVLAIMMLARIGAGTSFRDWLKAAWITFIVLFCIRAGFFFVSMGNSGITITCIFIAGMTVMIWHKTAHHGWSAWWAKL